jgi:hypothetical protein
VKTLDNTLIIIQITSAAHAGTLNAVPIKGKFHLKTCPERQEEEKVDVYVYSFFNRNARWGWMVKAMSRPLYHGE